MYTILADILGESASAFMQATEAKGRSVAEPAVIKERLTKEQALALEERQLELPGFEVQAIPIRSYQGDSGLAHILGYTGRANGEELRDRDDLSPIDFIGHSGFTLE